MTAFILGAGASKHAGYPLAPELGQDLLDWLRQKTDPILRTYAEYMREVREAYGDLGDIEQIIFDLDNADHASPAEGIDRTRRKKIPQAIRYSVAEFFYDILSSHPSPLYSQLSREKVQPKDSVITFNYDVACERELKAAGHWEIGDGYGFPLNLTGIPTAAVKTLKLHGSANWIDMFFGGIRVGQSPPSSLGERPVIFDPRNFESLGYSKDVRDPECWGARPTGGQTAVIMGLQKRFFSDTSFGREREGFWDSLWSQAAEILAKTQTIVIIGYSFPEADQRARDLILKGANRNSKVTVCCGRASARIVGELRENGFVNAHTLGAGRFEDYLGPSNPGV
jgi:hypothetical protein